MNKDPRFEREVELLQHCPHPSIPRFDDVGFWTSPEGERYPTAPPCATAYRPPEQRHFTWCFRKELEARWQAQPTDDLYSLGVAFYRSEDEEVLSDTDEATASLGSTTTEQGHPRGELRVPAWLSWASAAVVGGLVALAGVEFLHVACRGRSPRWRLQAIPPWRRGPR